MDYQDRCALRARLRRAVTNAEREYCRLFNRELYDQADEARQRWEILFLATHDVMTFDFNKEA